MLYFIFLIFFIYHSPLLCFSLNEYKQLFIVKLPIYPTLGAFIENGNRVSYILTVLGTCTYKKLKAL